MNRAGYVLAGGRSSRMGENKALLPWGGHTLVQHAARTVEAVAGSAVIVGEPDLYGGLGVAVIPDRRAECGPLAGIETALTHSQADWNLIVACDLPALRIAFLEQLFEAASDCDVAVPAGHPLCAVWSRNCGSKVTSALDAGVRAVKHMLELLRVNTVPVADESVLQNVNTPYDWNQWKNTFRTT